MLLPFGGEPMFGVAKTASAARFAPEIGRLTTWVLADDEMLTSAVIALPAWPPRAESF
jgi:hypothetical protein